MNSNIEPISYVYLETTNYCNLDCSFCNRRDVVKHAQHMSLKDWVIVQEKIKTFGQNIHRCRIDLMNY